MPRLATFMLFAFTLLSIGTVPIAHALERAACVEIVGMAHADLDQGGEGTQDSDTTDKAVQHQHGGCHGHHCASLANGSTVAGLVRPRLSRVNRPADALAATAPDPALRPPQA